MVHVFLLSWLGGITNKAKIKAVDAGNIQSAWPRAIHRVASAKLTKDKKAASVGLSIIYCRKFISFLRISPLWPQISPPTGFWLV